MEEKELLKHIGQNIKKLRMENQMLQQDLAAVCNIEVPNMSRIENGKSNLTIRTLYKIANALGVSIKTLVDTDNELIPH